MPANTEEIIIFALQQYLLIAVLTLVTNAIITSSNPNWVGTTPTVYGMRRRV